MTDLSRPAAPLLIADCGASSGKWAFVDPAGGSTIRFATGPLNVAVQSDVSVREALATAREACPEPPSAITIFAAGVIGPAADSLAAMVCDIFGLPLSAITIESDLTGAAQALLGSHRGIACILGTGSNSCLWDGSSIISNIRPMGYILGDEGSGAAIGAALLRAAIRGSMPPVIAARWAEAYPDVTYPTIVEEVYHRHAGSAMIASFVPFAARNISHPFIDSLVCSCFDRFFTEVIALYPEAGRLPLAFTGGVAAAFEPQLIKVAERRGIEISLITADPLSLLISRITGAL